MQFAYLLCGGSPVYKKYKVAATHVVGIPVIRTASGAGGISTATTTSVANSLGITVDRGLAPAAGGTISYSTTQGDNEAVYTVIVNPDAIHRALMVTGATGTSLTNRTVTTASAGGTAVTTGFDYNTTDMDEGIIWCTSGANVGLSRKITSTSTTAATVTVPFPNAIAVGDTFVHSPMFPGEILSTLTTDLLSIRTDLAKTGANIGCVDFELNGTGDSYQHTQIQDHVFAGAIT